MIRIHITSYNNSKTIYEKKITLKDFFLSSVDKLNIEDKNILENRKSVKGLVNQQNQKILKINLPRIPSISPYSTTSNSTSGFLSSLSSFLNRSLSNFSNSSNSSSIDKIEKFESKAEERTQHDVHDAENLVYQSEIKKKINLKNFSEDRVDIFLSFRFVSLISCLYLQSALELIDTTVDSTAGYNDNSNKNINNNYNNNYNNYMNNNNNDSNNQSINRRKASIEKQSSVYYFDDNLLPKQISKMDFLSEFHFLIAYSNIYVVSTVMSVLASKSHLKSALLLSDSNSCNALDIALRRGEEDSLCLIQFI